jgi:hypothetical protein
MIRTAYLKPLAMLVPSTAALRDPAPHAMSLRELMEEVASLLASCFLGLRLRPADLESVGVVVLAFVPTRVAPFLSVPKHS